MNTVLSNQHGVSLSVRGLHKSYDGIEVLKGVDFEVNPGEIFVIMGPSGCGKSVEEIFGWIKMVGGFRRSRYRGRERTQAWGYFVAGTYILLRMVRLAAA